MKMDFMSNRYNITRGSSYPYAKIHCQSDKARELMTDHIKSFYQKKTGKLDKYHIKFSPVRNRVIFPLFWKYVQDQYGNTHSMYAYSSRSVTGHQKNTLATILSSEEDIYCTVDFMGREIRCNTYDSLMRIYKCMKMIRYCVYAYVVVALAFCISVLYLFV